MTRVGCAVVPPVPVPYREPLFAGLASRGAVVLRVIYQAASEPGWDQRGDWFPRHHDYDAVTLRSWQRPRPGGWTPIVWPRGLERELTSFDPDCVVTWEYGPASLRALRWCRRHGRPLVIFSELTPDIDRILPAAQLRLQRWCAARASGFIAASSAARERLLGMEVRDNAIEVSLQTAQTDLFRAAAEQARDSRARDNRPVRVLTVGRLVENKNIERLIEAFAVAGLGPAQAELEVVGAGPLEPALRAAAERHGIGARFRGYVAPSELPNAYTGADVFALVSTVEPFGVAVREAVASGLPLICSRTAGAAGDLAVAGHNALLVDPASLTDIAQAVRRLVDEPDLRAEMARQSVAIDAATGIGDSIAAFERAIVRAVGRDAEVSPPPAAPL